MGQGQAVVSVHYTVEFDESGMKLGTSRGRWPLTFAPSVHEVPLFSEAVAGMRVGGRRRLSVPARLIPESQIANVPRDHEGEGLRIELELTAIEAGPMAAFGRALPPGNRRVTILRLLFALSFVPYFMPEAIKPEAYRFGDPQAIAAERRAAANSLWLGGAQAPLEDLFP